MAARRSSKKSSSVKVNFKGVETRKTPAEGDYLVEVLEATSGQSSAGNDQIEFTLEIAAGEYKGTKLWFYCPLADNSLWKLHAFLEALGEDVPQDEMEIDLPELLGKQCIGVITQEVYNGKKRAKMTDFESLADYTGDADIGKKSKKDKKKDKDDDSKSDKKKDKKGDEKKDDAKSSKKDKGEKKPKKLTTEEVDDMDEDELAALVKKHKLDVKLKGKLAKQQSAVRDALEEADLLAD